MIKKEDLIAGETVLVSESNTIAYQGCVGECLFFTYLNDGVKKADASYTIEEINYFGYRIKQPESKVVPLEKRTYDFVKVRIRDSYLEQWRNAELIAVDPDLFNSYIVKRCMASNGSYISFYKYCEFE